LTGHSKAKNEFNLNTGREEIKRLFCTNNKQNTDVDMLSFLRAIVIITGVTLVAGCTHAESYLQRSGSAVSPPPVNIPFEDYVNNTEAQILSVLTEKQTPSHYQHNQGSGYTQAVAAKMRAPFQIPANATTRCTDGDSGANKGFLLVHGLTDSPYLMTGLAASVHNQYPCALIRAIVLPGHSTIPGDTLSSKDMTYQKWQEATAYGVSSFDKMDDIRSVYVLSFSTGAPLLIRHIKEHENDNTKIKGAVFISAAIKAKNKWAFSASFLQHFIDWTDLHNEQDAARYESFSFHAGAEFYELTTVLDKDQYQFTLPLFVAISADDTTVSAEAALNYFCAAKNPIKKLIWYEYADSKEPLSNFAGNIGDCRKDITVRTPKDVVNIPSQYVSFSHTSLSMPPNDDHYGVNGNYKQCKDYYDFDKPESQEFTGCVKAEGDHYIVGEGTKELKAYAKDKGLYWRRGTYNADYDFMVEQIISFLGSLP
jgi:esterase/lipase